MIHLTIEDAASIVAVAVVFWGVLKFGLTSPLENAIKDLRQSIQQMNDDNRQRDQGFQRLTERVNSHETQLATHEERISQLEGEKHNER